MRARRDGVCVVCGDGHEGRLFDGRWAQEWVLVDIERTVAQVFEVPERPSSLILNQTGLYLVSTTPQAGKERHTLVLVTSPGILCPGSEPCTVGQDGAHV